MYIRSLKIDYAKEKKLLVVRKHWFVFFLETIPFVVLAIAPRILYLFLQANINFVLAPKYSYSLLSAYFAWILFLWIILFIRWTVYYLDIWVLTDKRIFDLNQHWLFHRDITVLRLEQIEDIKIEVPGLFATLLNYGNVEVQTAGAEQDQFLIRNIRNPYKVKEIISRAYDTAVEK